MRLGTEQRGKEYSVSPESENRSAVQGSHSFWLMVAAHASMRQECVMQWVLNGDFYPLLSVVYPNTTLF